MVPQINLEDYNLELPVDKIAGFPTTKREESRLLVVSKHDQNIENKIFSDAVDYVPSGTLIIRNATKVIPARLFFNKPTGGLVELLLIKPIAPSSDYQMNLASISDVTWECIYGGRIKNHNELFIKLNGISLNASILQKHDNIALVKFIWAPNTLSFSQVLDIIGNMPLPPYIKRKSLEIDKQRYQTVYAKIDGSVAAPTAGLHFTKDIFVELEQKKCQIADAILHVGLGTFLPISSNDISNHIMHREELVISKILIEQIYNTLRTNNKIFAVGTTSVRTIESLFWWAVNFIKNPNMDFVLKLEQDVPYNSIVDKGKIEIISELLDRMEKHNITEIKGCTRLFILPSYKFQLINGIFTNFHLPKSTLILLVAAFLGKDLWRKTYETALNQDYRFLSYGDSSLLLE